MKIKSILIILVITVILLNTGCVEEDNDECCVEEDNDESENEKTEEIPYATFEEIEVNISFSKIYFSNDWEYLVLNVEIKNIADGDRRIIEYLYTVPSDDNYYYIFGNDTSYRFIREHGDGDFEAKVVLKSGGSFYYQFEDSIDRIYENNSKMNPHDTSFDFYSIYMSIPIYSPLRMYKESNTIEVERELFVKE